MASIQVGPNESLFLLGAYGRYAWPYVWLRSNAAGCIPEFNKDKPVELQSIREWKRKGTRVWDFVEELVNLEATVAVQNPFEVDFVELNQLQTAERAAMAGATASFLQKLLLQRLESKYTPLIKEDLQRLLVCHFKWQFQRS